MQKLIKISEEHYVVVDDSKIKNDNWALLNYPSGKEIVLMTEDVPFKNATCINSENKFHHCGHKKITHSFGIELDGIKKRPLSEVEKLIYGYSVEEMTKNAYSKHSVKNDRLSLDEQIQRTGGFNVGYKEGFSAYKELTKDKLFTIEDMKESFLKGINFAHKPHPKDMELEKEFIESLVPQIEWDIEIINGKIRLK